MPVNITATLVAQKLQALARLESSFEASFHFAQDMQGLRRSGGVPVRHVVFYLHALYVCAVKDRLLGIPRSADRYDGEECLRALSYLQDGVVASTIALLERKLDGSAIVHLTRELEQVPAGTTPDDMTQRARQLRRGQQVSLNRVANRLRALDTLCGLSHEDLARQVRQACAHYRHTPRQIERQLADLDTPLFQTLPHPALARRNMLLMERMGVGLRSENAHVPASQVPGESPRRDMPAAPFAEELIQPYYDLTAPWHNNPADLSLERIGEYTTPPPAGSAVEDIIV